MQAETALHDDDLESPLCIPQSDIDLMMSHINSYKRKKLNDRSAHQLFNFYYGEDVLNKLNATLISADDIILKPSLLEK